jgi:hypothetical protein
MGFFKNIPTEQLCLFLCRHFILELIQNAEDNSYPEGQEPQLLFSLAPGDPTAGGDNGNQGTQMTLGLFNNEVGFKEENVDALCSVGE